MTIAKLIELLEQYGKYYGTDEEIKCYVGMSKKVAQQRIRQLRFDDEYVFDDFLDIENLNMIGVKDNKPFVYLRTSDITEGE